MFHRKGRPATAGKRELDDPLAHRIPSGGGGNPLRERERRIRKKGERGLRLEGTYKVGTPEKADEICLRRDGRLEGRTERGALKRDLTRGGPIGHP